MKLCEDAHQRLKEVLQVSRNSNALLLCVVFVALFADNLLFTIVGKIVRTRSNTLINNRPSFQKQIKRDNVLDSTSQQIFDLEKLVFYS